MTKRMTPQEIFEHSDFVKDADIPWKDFYAMVHGLLTDTNEWRMLRINNSLFLYNIIEEGNVAVTIIDADTTKQFPKNLKEALNAFNKAKIHELIFNVQGKAFQQLLNQLGCKVTDKVLYKSPKGFPTYEVRAEYGLV